jgi:hypothetical protein
MPYEHFVRRFKCQNRQGRHFNPTVGDKSLHLISNDNGVGVINFGTAENLSQKYDVLTSQHL